MTRTSPADITKALAESEWLVLERFADDHGCGSVEYMLGVLCAAASHPSLDVQPSSWLPEVLGEHEFEDQAEAERLFSLLMRAYNETIRRLEEGQVAIPPLENLPELRQWCAGYMNTMNLDPSWQKDPEMWGLLAPVALLGVCDRQTAETREHLDESIAELEAEDACTAVVSAAEYSKGVRARAIRQLKAARTRRSAAPRPGRNDPCPCGSGRKFKRCCLQ